MHCSTWLQRYGCVPQIGAVCWLPISRNRLHLLGNDDDCMKTRIEKFKEIEKRDHTDDGTP